MMKNNILVLSRRKRSNLKNQKSSPQSSPSTKSTSSTGKSHPSGIQNTVQVINRGNAKKLTTTPPTTTIKSPPETTKLSPSSIAAIVLGIFIFLIILALVFKKWCAFMKHKSRKKSTDLNDYIQEEDIYAEIDESTVDQPAPLQKTGAHLISEMTGGYSHLPEIKVPNQKTESVEMSLMIDPSGYSHVVTKNEKSGAGQEEAPPIDCNSSQYEQLVTKEANNYNGNCFSNKGYASNDFDGEQNTNSKGQNVYNVLENTGSGERPVCEEDQNVYNELENTGSGERPVCEEEQNVYNVLENAGSGERPVCEEEQNVYNVLENAGSGERPVCEEDQDVHNVLENAGSNERPVCQEDQNVYNVLENTDSGERAVCEKDQGAYNVLENTGSGERPVCEEEQNMNNVLENTCSD